MLPLSGTAAKLGLCQRQGGGFLVEIEPAMAHKLDLKRGGDVDFVAYVATYRSRAVAAKLSSMTGLHVSGLRPAAEWIDSISALTVQSLSCGDVQWIDLRGISGAGLESRWLGYPHGYVQYSRVTKEAAQVFDSAIDGGCCLPVR